MQYLKDWTLNQHFYPEAELIMSIKSFDLAAIRKRYLESRKNKSGKGGSVERRAVSLGGIAQVKLQKGKLEVQQLVKSLKEPRGLSSAGDRLAFSLENQVIVLDSEGVWSFSNPWFSYIHTVSFHPQYKNRVLVSSSGFDAVFECDYKNGTIIWEWFAWENGIAEAHGPDGKSLLLTRKEEQHTAWKKEGLAHIYISDPLSDHLPTAQRAAFINTASYDLQGNVLATFFHEGSVRRINRRDGKSEVLIKGLKNPHGGFLISESTIMATNTGKGELWVANKQSQEKYSGLELKDKAPEMLDAEWWQNAISFHDYFIVIDSNRNALLILDPSEKQYDLLPYDKQWAVQDLVLLDGQEPAFAEALKKFQSKD